MCYQVPLHHSSDTKKFLRGAVTEYEWAQEKLIETAISELSFESTIIDLYGAYITEKDIRGTVPQSSLYHSQ